MFRLLWACLILSQSWQIKSLLHLGSNVITDGPLLHLCLPQVPLTRNLDPWSEFGLRGNKHLASLDGIFRGVIFPPLPETKICVIYGNKAKGQIRKLRLTLLRSKMKKEIHAFRLRGRRNYESPKDACSSSPRLYRWKSALKRGQKWNK